MKTKLLLSIIIFLFTVNITMAQEGWYVNNGKRLITELPCYDFDNLMLKYTVPSSASGFDRIDCIVFFADAKGNTIGNPYADIYESSIAYTASASGGIMWIFKTENSQGEFQNYEQYDDNVFELITRSDLQYGSKKTLEGTTFIAAVYGKTITGYDEKVDANGVWHKTPVFSDRTKLYESPPLALKNRLNDGGYGKAVLNAYSFGLAGKNKEVKSGNCFTDPIPDNGTTAPVSSNTTKTNNTSSNAPAANTNTKKTSSNTGNKNTSSIPDGPYEKKYPDGNVQMAGDMKNNKPVGPWKEYYENGTVKEEESYVDGIEEGMEIKYTSSGDIDEKTEYKGGKKNGKHLEFGSDGILIKDESYTEDKLNGKSTYYNSSGTKYEEINYMNGKKDGQNMTYETIDKSVKEIITYKDGKKNGPYKHFSKKILWEEGAYVNGLKDGIWKKYDPNKGTLLETTTFKDGVPQ